MTSPGVVRLDVVAAVLAAGSPFAEEDLSLAGGVAMLVVADDVVDAWMSWRAGGGDVSALPCVTAARVPQGAVEEAEALGFDVVFTPRVADAEEVLVSAVTANPRAACALVQLVRTAGDRDTEAGLFVESTVYGLLQSGREFAAWLALERDVPALELLMRDAPALTGKAPLAPAVIVERSGDEVEIALNRPHVRNALDARMRDDLVETLRTLVGDPTVRRVRLVGRGPAFCSGGDLDEFGTQRDPTLAHAVRSARHPARWLARLAATTTVVAEVHGACIGAGIELAAYCTEVVAHEDAFFMLPEVRMGLVPGAGGTVSIPRRIGARRFTWMALTGARVDVATAKAWGLVDRVA